MTQHCGWAAAQYCDDWSSAHPGATDAPAWVDTGSKYLRLCRWAQRRYTVDGTLATHIAGKPTTY